MKVTSYGAAQTVTGSCHGVEIDGLRFLIDCGMFQGSKELNRKNYQGFQFNPKDFDFLILTHAHQDHCGLLPKLVKEGFSGSIFLTPPSKDLLPVMLRDSAFIQEMDTKQENKRRLRQGLEPRKPLYTRDDAELVFPLMEPVDYEILTEVAPGVSFRFWNAGHVIGSAMVELIIQDLDGGERPHRVVFSGDIGQWDTPILKDPALLEEAHQVFMESTYGDRLHPEGQDRAQELGRVIRETVARGGKVMIPTFALERTQELLYILSSMSERGELKDIPVFLDSPLAIKITRVFQKHTDVYDADAQARTGDPFSFPELQMTLDSEDSMMINSFEGPAVILAGSGMCTGGRIRHHIKHHIWDDRNTMLFVGYQAWGTLGRYILDGATEIRMMGGTFAVKAQIERISSFSGHADQDDLTKWITAFTPKPQAVYLIHGEEKTMTHFAEHLRGKGLKVKVPVEGKGINLGK
jgi:metallo-beta-lactamase family protein